MPTSLSIKFESETVSQCIGKTVSDLIADWSDGEIFSAQQILADNPQLRDDHSVVLDLAYEEFCRRTERGEAVDPAEFVNRFPGVETPLLDLIDVHQVLYENPSVLTETGLPRWPEVGESHLDLQLLEQIGSGSFSQVYIARESGVGERRVVAKLCTNANHEASLLGRLQHPNIVPILSVKTDTQKNLSAICMPYMGRTTLANSIEYLHRRGPQQVTSRDLITMLSEREHETAPVPGHESGFALRSQLQDALIDISIQLCRGLEFAHSRGVIHGDLKPSNILLTKQGTALLMDFNLSERMRPESQARGGTLAYMAPEQLSVLSLGHRLPQSVTCSEQTDVYSFGVLLLELFTGSHPYLSQPQKEAPAESARKLFEEQRTKPISADDLVPKVGSSLAAIIAQCLELDPRKRWSNVTELRTALEGTMTLKGRAVRWVRRERKRVIIAGVGLCCAFVAASLVYASLPYESERLYDSAVIAMQQARFEKAVESLDQASLLETQRLGTAEAKTKELLADAHARLGAQYLQDARYEKSIEQLVAARSLDPASESIRAELLNAYLQSGEFALKETLSEDAVVAFKAARELDPDSTHILFRLSRALLADKDFDKAVDVATVWVTREPDNARAFANRGYCYFRQASARTAEISVARAVSAELAGPYSFEEVTALASSLGAAFNDFNHALELEGDVSRVAILNNIGLCYCRNGQHHQAAKPLEEAMAMSGNLSTSAERVTPFLLYIESHFGHALRIRKIDADFSWLDDCLRNAPESSEILISAGRYYALASRFTDTDQELSDQYLEQCIRYCDQAYSLGIYRDDLENVQQHQKRLANHKYWQLLIGTTATRNAQPERRDNLLEPLL